MRELVFYPTGGEEVQSEHVPKNRLTQAAFGAEHMMHELGEHRRQIALGVTEFTDDPGLIDTFRVDEHMLLRREVEIERPSGHARVGDDRADIGRGRSSPRDLRQRRVEQAGVFRRRAWRTPAAGDRVADGAGGDPMEARYANSLIVVNDGCQRGALPNR
ncbi:hypothetical protein A5686_11270 [Mycobacterium sp. E2479]|nr:hypothetical protein A5686_11270 [Mycobacterium sp. E2479]